MRLFLVSAILFFSIAAYHLFSPAPAAPTTPPASPLIIVAAILDCPEEAAVILATRSASPSCRR